MRTIGSKVIVEGKAGTVTAVHDATTPVTYTVVFEDGGETTADDLGMADYVVNYGGDKDSDVAKTSEIPEG